MQQMTGFPLIDVHQHVIPDFYRSALARVGILGSGENPWPQWSMARTLELMDENGIAGVDDLDRVAWGVFRRRRIHQGFDASM